MPRPYSHYLTAAKDARIYNPALLILFHSSIIPSFISFFGLFILITLIFILFSLDKILKRVYNI